MYVGAALVGRVHLELAFKYPPRLLHLVDPYVFLAEVENWGYQLNTN
jgi:hypothetical protein